MIHTATFELNFTQPMASYQEEVQCAALGLMFLLLGVGNAVATVRALWRKKWKKGGSSDHHHQDHHHDHHHSDDSPSSRAGDSPSISSTDNNTTSGAAATNSAHRG